MASTYGASLPMLFTRGNYYEVGYQIGSTFKDRIQNFFKNSERVQTKLLPFFDFEKGREIYEIYLRSVEIQFPYYVDEIRGIADGCGFAFEKVFLYNMSQEVYDIHLQEVSERMDTSGCTTVLVNRPEMKVNAHNEDCDPTIAHYGYIVKAEISDAKYSERYESFTAFSYPGGLVGCTFGFNDSGMIVTMDGLLPKEIIPALTPRNFLNRAVLSVKDIDEAAKLFENKGYGCAFGFCANISSLQNPEKMWNIEVAPGQGKSQIKVHEIIEHKQHYVHSNLYQHLDIENTEGLFSSIARKVRADEFPPPKTISDVKKILGDTYNVKYPIFRQANEYNVNQTIATAIFDLCKKTLEVYIGNVKNVKPLITLPLI